MAEEENKNFNENIRPFASRMKNQIKRSCEMIMLMNWLAMSPLHKLRR